AGECEGLFGHSAAGSRLHETQDFPCNSEGNLFSRWWRFKRGKMDMATRATEHSKVVTPAEWLAARKDLLKKEKEFSRLRDEISRQRREMPWEKVEKPYTFDGPRG